MARRSPMRLVLLRRNQLLPVFIVASRLGVSVGFLLHARRAGYGPPCINFGDDARYHWPSVAAWAVKRGLPIFPEPGANMAEEAPLKNTRGIRIAPGLGLDADHHHFSRLPKAKGSLTQNEAPPQPKLMVSAVAVV